MKGEKKKKAMFDRYASRLMSEGATRKKYLGWVQDMLDYFEDTDFYDEEATRRKLQSFFRKVERHNNYSSGTMRLLWATIRAFFSRNLLPWPFGRGEAPQIDEAEVVKNAPAVDPNLVNEMIGVVREKGTSKHQALLAVASIYGTRRVELQRLKASDIRLKDRILYITTAKHGRARNHLIPEEIVPFLKYDFDQPRSASGTTMVWYEIEDLANVEHYPRVGFHSIRRTLDTILGQHFSPSDVKMFLRWKQKGSPDMQMVYSSTVFVGRSGPTNTLRPQLGDLDRRIFTKHPFLEAWR
jgi:integrase